MGIGNINYQEHHNKIFTTFRAWWDIFDRKKKCKENIHHATLLHSFITDIHRSRSAIPAAYFIPLLFLE